MRVSARERRNRAVRFAAIAGVVAALVAVAAGCGSSKKSSGGTTASTSNVSGTVTFDGVWTSSTGQKQFQDVIDAFNKQYPNVHVKYKPVGNSLPTVLATAVAGGHPPTWPTSPSRARSSSS